jgi:hypothetical protein
VNKCQNWYVDNNLFLTQDSRRAFSQAYHSASTLSQFINMIPDLASEDKKREDIEQIRHALNTIAKSILPSWTQEDKDEPIEIKEEA